MPMHARTLWDTAELWRRRRGAAIRFKKDEHLRWLDEEVLAELYESPSEARRKLKPSMNNADYFNVDGRKPPWQETDAMKKALMKAGEGARAARREAWAWRTAAEMDSAIQRGWYAWMSTLTLDHGAMNNAGEVIAEGWRRYKHAIEDRIGPGGRAGRKGDKNEWRSYIAVVELGTETQRLHLHAIWTAKDVPDAWKTDPNTHSPYATRTEIPAMAGLWRHGRTMDTAIRLSPEDAWGRLGWRWPRHKTKTEWAKVQHPGSVGRYLAQYVSKGVGLGPLKPKETLWQTTEIPRWRTRA